MISDVVLADGSRPTKPPRVSGLFEAIASFPALRAAALRAARGKRYKPGAASFLAGLEHEVLLLERELRDQSWRSGGYTTIELRVPKHRIVSAAPFRDRVVHHALHACIVPLSERGFIFDSYANRKGKGTHRAVERYERFRNRFRFVLRCDVYRYFPSIDHEVLKRDLRRRVRCDRTLWLADAIVDGSNPQEPVHEYYPGDELFTPFERRRGLPIGNLTSQFFGNIYLDRFDHFVKEVLRAKGYLRYVDDFALFHDDPAMLENWRNRIADYLARRRLSLHPAKTRIVAAAEPAEFLGLVLFENGRRALPEENVRRFRNRLRGLRDRWRSGTIAWDEVERRVEGWIAHAGHADTWRLRHAIFRGGHFDPPWGPGRPHSTRVLRGGSWNNKPENVRSANRNRNTTEDRNNNNGFRVASTPQARAATPPGMTGAPGSVQGRP